MSLYPYELDDDTTIIRVDDNVTEISGQNFNQVRDAIFRIEEELGIKPSGSMDSLKEFLGVSLESNGTIKNSALAAVGLVTLPIDNSMIGINAGIWESKLQLDFTTSDLRQMISQNSDAVNAINAVVGGLIIDLNGHIGGGPSSDLRHVASHIDINAIPSDDRDPLFNWTGLIDTNGDVRSATNVAEALQQINDELVGHENQATAAHNASAIYVDTSNFSEISREANNVQDALEQLDAIEELRIGLHRAIMHSNGVPADARSQAITKINDAGQVIQIDGYGDTVVRPTQVQTFVSVYPGTSPVDDVNTGDKIVKFIPPTDAAERLVFESQFAQVSPGDIVRLTYGDGYNFEAQYIVESSRYIPGSDYFVRLDSNNLIETLDAYARIDHPLFDPNIYGVAVVAPSNAAPIGDFPGYYPSVTICDPRSASVLGIGFDANQIDSRHYKLYLQMYPTGNPADRVVTLPYIDVSGNAGATPGKYTLDSIILATNNAFRSAGYNFRFLAFQYEGNFGIAMSDPFNTAAFSIVTGDWSTGLPDEGSFTENVIGDINPDNKQYDALGLGENHSGWASPAYRSTFVDVADAQKPAKIIMPRKERFYVSNGSRRDFLRSSVGLYDGYYLASIVERIETVNSVETSYIVEGRLDTIGLTPGKTLTVLPDIEPESTVLYNDNDYGRFIIKSVVYQPSCFGDPEKTIITVLNGVHGAGDPKGNSSGPTFPFNVRLYFGNDTVGFNINHMIDGSTPSANNYHRLFEIYVDQNAKTFSHERARMKIQSDSGTNLGTKNWHINSVSPKFRGYLDDGASEFNRFIRLKVLSYDSYSGEFEVQIGKRPNPPTGTNILVPGEIVKGRKDIPFRVFDETGNDFIELEFIETSDVPSSIVVNSFVDIEVFPSLELDDELLLLATCEVNWNPEDGLLVDRVRDRRPIGSISEKEFTKSAKNFITSGDRALHSNGIIRDLGFVSVSLQDGATLLFNGGEALVNGTIVNVNNGKVIIPQLVQEGGGSGSTVDWIVCVNEVGDFVTYPLTTTKTQFFAEAGTGGGIAYFIPSVTFSEVVNERKDLVPVAILTATIASITISNVRDVRRFISDETFNIPFVWAEDDNKSFANFRSSDALQAWVSNINSNSLYLRQKITIRGDVVLDGYLDLSDVPNLIIEAEGNNSARITVNSDTGLIISSNTTIKNVNFVYNPITASPTNIVGISLADPNGCILVEPENGTDLENIKIEGCVFESSTVNYRFPFVYVNLNNNIIKNLNVNSNKFSDSSAINSAAVVIAEKNSAGTTRSLIDGLEICNNVCDNYQGLFLIGGTSSGAIQPISYINAHIKENKCGYIGLSAGSTIENAVTNIANCLIVSENNCGLIFGSPNYIGECRYYPIGSTIINNNICTKIYILVENTSTPREGQASLVINQNTLVNTMQIDATGVFNESAIFVQSYDATQKSIITISNNNIMEGASSSSSTPRFYLNGISTAGYFLIKENSIRGFTSSGISNYSTAGYATTISGNIISRYSTSINSYIFTDGKAVIIDNNLDKNTVDGANYVNSIIYGTESIVDRNVNFLQTLNLKQANGKKVYGINSGDVIIGSDSTGSIKYSYNLSFSNTYNNLYLQYYTPSGGFRKCGYIFSVKEILPQNVKITSIRLEVKADSIFNTTGSAILHFTKNGIKIDGTSLSLTSGYTPGTLLQDTVSVDSLVRYVDDIYLDLSLNSLSGATITVYGDIIITYTY
jgi:hypothetical protein